MEIIISTHALRQLRKIPAQTREDILAALDSLAGWPNVLNVKSLKNRDDYRLRVGRYRVIFEVSNNTIFINQVVIRNENTY